MGILITTFLVEGELNRRLEHGPSPNKLARRGLGSSDRCWGVTHYAYT